MEWWEGWLILMVTLSIQHKILVVFFKGRKFKKD